MYTMYAEIWDLTGHQAQKLYDPSDSTGTYALTSPKLVMEESAAGKLTFNIPSSNNCFEYFYNTTDQNGEANALNLYVDVRKDDAVVWKGRVVQKEIDFWNCIDVTCEGLLSVLNDTIQPPNFYGNLTPRNYLSDLLDLHNFRVNDDSRKIFLGEVTVGNKAVSGLNQYTNYETTLECIIEKIVKNIGGRIKLRYDSYNTRWVLDYLKEYEPEISQRIEFGKNLFDYSRTMTSEDYCTVVVPRGKQLEEGEYEDIKAYTTVAEANSGSIYVELATSDYSPSIPASSLPTALYGRIEKVVDWSDVDDSQTLLQLGKEWLKDKQFGNMELEVTAMDLSLAGVAYDSIDLGDTVRVISTPHGLDRAFPVTKMEINLETPEDTMFVLGAAVKLSLTSTSNKQNKNTQFLLDEIPTQQKLSTVFMNQAADMINSATSGYVNIIQNDETGAEEFVISDIPDYKAKYKATEPNKHLGVWRWTFGGLGFQKTYGGSGDSFTMALTRDGHINGKLIAAESIVGDKIYGGIIADTKSPHNFWFDLTNGTYQIKAIDEINTSIATINGKFSSYVTTSELTQTASQIQSTVSSTYATKTTVNNKISEVKTTFSSQISQQSTRINLRVMGYVQDDVNGTVDYNGHKYKKSGNTIISYINLDATTAVIKATKIKLESFTFDLTTKKLKIKSDHFNVSTDGTITATAGKIGGFTIDATSIRTKTLTDNSSSSIGLSTVEFIRTIGGTERTGLRFAIGSRFGVSATGILYTSYITATGGTVGGFTITGTSIYSTSSISNNGTGAVGLSTTNFTRTVAGSSRSNLRFAIGSKFGVTDTGVLYATDAVISGTISSTNANITGGYFHVVTSSDTANIISLTTGSTNLTLRPRGVYLTSNNGTTNITAGDISISNSSRTRVWLTNYQIRWFGSDGSITFDWDGNRIINAVTNYGNIAYTGQITGDSASVSKTIANKTWTAIRSISVGQGKWIIIANFQFSSNSKGYRRAVISSSSGSRYNVINSAYYSSPAVDGDETQGTLVVQVSGPGTYYLNAYQTCGVGLLTYGQIRAIRIV